MVHERVLDAYAAGDQDDDVLAHLGTCQVCRAYADRLDTVRRSAPTFAVPRAPAGLADRVVRRVRQARGSGGLPVVVAPPAWRRVRGPLLAAASIAAVSALVAGVLATARRAPEPLDALVAAASATRAADSARVRLSGRAEVRLVLPEIRTPQVPDVPVPEIPTPDFSGLPEDARAQAERAFAEAQRRAREELARPTPPPHPIPRELRVTTDVVGAGHVVLPDHLQLSGTVETATDGVTAPRRTFDIVSADGRTYYRGGGSGWASLPGPVGPFGSLVVGGLDLASVMRPDGTVTELGTDEVDGAEVRGYRFAVAPPGRTGGARWTTDVWIGVEDDLVRRVRTAATGSSGSEGAIGTAADWRTAMTLELYDFGAPLDVSPPPAEAVTDVVPTDAVFGFMYPFGAHLRADLAPMP